MDITLTATPPPSVVATWASSAAELRAASRSLVHLFATNFTGSEPPYLPLAPAVVEQATAGVAAMSDAYHHAADALRGALPYVDGATSDTIGQYVKLTDWNAENRSFTGTKLGDLMITANGDNWFAGQDADVLEALVHAAPGS